MLYLVSCRVIVFMGRKRPYGEVLGLISLHPQRSDYARETLCRSAQPQAAQSRSAGLHASATFALPGLSYWPQCFQFFEWKGKGFKMGLKENNGACVEWRKVQHNLFSDSLGIVRMFLYGILPHPTGKRRLPLTLLSSLKPWRKLSFLLLPSLTCFSSGRRRSGKSLLPPGWLWRLLLYCQCFHSPP